MGLLAKPSITAAGFRTAVRDYTEPSVVEELAANSYDADASTLLVLLDNRGNKLHLIDDGSGFSKDAIQAVATLGGGDKLSVHVSKGRRHYLGSYGYGLKSTLNIASQAVIETFSSDGHFAVTIDWSRLDEAMKESFPGYDITDGRGRFKEFGTVITLTLKNPTEKNHLEAFGEVLANLPQDDGKFRCYFGFQEKVAKFLPTAPKVFVGLDSLARRLAKKGLLTYAGESRHADLEDCEVIKVKPKADRSVTGQIYFAGIQSGKVRSIKPGLRGIYVRIHGRLLKQSFTDRKYTYNISKWVKFENGLRIELNIDWLRDQITLSREGLRFGNPKLEQDFKSTLSHVVSSFIQPQLKKLESKRARSEDRKQRQREELAQKRAGKSAQRVLAGADVGFPFKPDTDGELALLVAQREVLKRVNPRWELIDYDDKATYDCMIYDRQHREMIHVELEPTLMEFLQHRETEGVKTVMTWTLGKWRVGSKKKGRPGVLELVATEGAARGRYRLLEYSTAKSKTARAEYEVIALDEILGKKRGG